MRPCWAEGAIVCFYNLGCRSCGDELDPVTLPVSGTWNCSIERKLNAIDTVPHPPSNCAAVMQVPHIDDESHVYTRVNSWPDHLSKSRPPERVSTNELSSNSTAVQNNQLALIGMLANSYLQEKKGMRRPNMPPHKKGVASRRSGGTINATPSLVDYKYCTSGRIVSWSPRDANACVIGILWCGQIRHSFPR